MSSIMSESNDETMRRNISWLEESFFDKDRSMFLSFLTECVPYEFFGDIIPNTPMLTPADILWGILYSGGENRRRLLTKLGYGYVRCGRWCANSEGCDDTIIKEFYAENKDTSKEYIAAKEFLKEYGDILDSDETSEDKTVVDIHKMQLESANSATEMERDLEAICAFCASNEALMSIYDKFDFRDEAVKIIVANRLCYMFNKGLAITYKNADGNLTVCEKVGTGSLYSFSLSALLHRYGLTEYFNKSKKSGEWVRYAQREKESRWVGNVEYRPDGAIVLYPENASSKEIKHLHIMISKMIDKIKADGVNISGVHFDVRSGSLYDMPLEVVKRMLDKLGKDNPLYSELRDSLEDMSEEDWEQTREDMKASIEEMFENGIDFSDDDYDESDSDE